MSSVSLLDNLFLVSLDKLDIGDFEETIVAIFEYHNVHTRRKTTWAAVQALLSRLD